MGPELLLFGENGGGPIGLPEPSGQSQRHLLHWYLLSGPYFSCAVIRPFFGGWSISNDLGAITFAVYAGSSCKFPSAAGISFGIHVYSALGVEAGVSNFGCCDFSKTPSAIQKTITNKIARLRLKKEGRFLQVSHVRLDHNLSSRA